MVLCKFCKLAPATTTVDMGVQQVTIRNVCNSCRDAYLNGQPINGRYIIKHVRPESQRDAGVRRIREDGYNRGMTEEETEGFVVMWLTGQAEYASGIEILGVMQFFS